MNANRERLLHCGLETVLWDRVSLVACYITMETAFSKAFGFTDAYCWWAATVTTDLVQPKNWLLMLYLASNFFSLDPRDVIYGLRGMMDLGKGAELLEPDYSKSVAEVYQDSVEAALVGFNTTDVLLYVHGTESPSWVPRWDIPMLFRNPFRFGKPLPWRPAGDTTPIWSIDKKSSILSLSGFVVGPIEFVEPYNESCFGNVMTESDEGRKTLNQVWQRILETMRKRLLNVPFTAEELTAAATSFSFGLDEKSNPANEELLLQRFVAYLGLALDEEVYNTYVPADVSEDAKNTDGRLFGKPVWDFSYPESSFFITEDKFIGCSITSTRPGDVIYVARGCTYPLVLRPEGEEYQIRGFAFVHGLMRAERQDSKIQVLKIR